ncbi:MAG TPA: bifunctional diguanylate cyclase/phosphodiesterase [Stellaceae bacterium]|nr:bifunctional diguanylate cyclase/phosphodiesterase [Stellaceae bacterium]
MVMESHDLETLSRLVTPVPTAVAWFDRDLRYLAASAAWIAAFGIVHRPLAGQRHGDVSGLAEAPLNEVLRRALAGEAAAETAIAAGQPAPPAAHRVLSARPFSDAQGAVGGAVVVAHRAPTEAAAAALGESGLVARHEFARHLHEALADGDPERREIIVFAINLDRFRAINNLHGTAIGDQVLEVTAERLISGTRARSPGETQGTRPRDVIARLGADEFGIICPAATLPAVEADALAQRLLGAVQNPIAIGPHSLRLTASIGFIVPTAEHTRADDVLRDLDLALQQAKALGANRVVGWEPSLTQDATRRYSLSGQLRQAFENGELMLHYQPVLRLSDNRMVGAEALLRWNHPSEGLVKSRTFIPALEEMGLVSEVGCWVIRETVRQLESWRLLYGRDVIDWVSINLSGSQLGDPSPLFATLHAVRDGGFPLHRLKTEIAEAGIMRNPDKTRAVLTELAGLGIRVAIDDFGTGYSSLNSLRDLPIEAIKIDSEFVAQIGAQEGERLTLALLDMARVFGAAIVAEGIETEGQREFLRTAGCGFGQGYLFAEPMDGALLGAYALTHAVIADRPPMPDDDGGPLNPPTSAGPLRAG